MFTVWIVHKGLEKQSCGAFSIAMLLLFKVIVSPVLSRPLSSKQPEKSQVYICPLPLSPPLSLFQAPPTFPSCSHLIFALLVLIMFLLYYLRAWHRLPTANSPIPISRRFQGKKLISPLSLLTPPTPTPCPPHYYSLLINDTLY